MARLNRGVTPVPPPPAMEGGGGPQGTPPRATGTRTPSRPRLSPPPLPPSPPRRPALPAPGPLTPPPEILRTPSVPSWLQPPPNLQSAPPRSHRNDPLTDRYREALEAQERLLRQWQLTP